MRRKQTSTMREFSKFLLVAACAAVALWTVRSAQAAPKSSEVDVPMQFIGSMPAVEVMVNE